MPEQFLEIEIPLERNDFITLPHDPRTLLPDYCYTTEHGDEFPWTLPLPRFWREVLRRIEQNVNEERKSNGKPKFSASFIQKRVLEQTRRVGAAQRRPDPRLERTLFAQPPKQLSPSSSNSHNLSVPNLKTSIFDPQDADDALSSSSSSDLSFSNSANENETANDRKRQSVLDSSDDEDADLSFAAFKNRRIAHAPSKVEKKNVNPNKNDTINGTSKIYCTLIDFSLATHKKPTIESNLYILNLFQLIRKSIAWTTAAAHR